MRANITHRSATRVSPWVSLVSKTVAFSPGGSSEVYHCLAQPDYVSVFARTRGGLIPIIRQYRPAVEAYTWELPAGLLEPGELPDAACRRELKEEAGLDVVQLTPLGSYYADTGRLENRIHAFFALTSDPDPAFTPEPGLSVSFVETKTLREYILNGQFSHQLHLALLALVSVRRLDGEDGWSSVA